MYVCVRARVCMCGEGEKESARMHAGEGGSRTTHGGLLRFQWNITMFHNAQVFFSPGSFRFSRDEPRNLLPKGLNT